MPQKTKKKSNAFVVNHELELQRLRVLLEKQAILIQQMEGKQSFFEYILAHVPGHVYWLDRNNVYLGCNEEHAKTAGLKSRLQIVGKTNWDLSWREYAEALDNLNNLVMSTGKSQVKEESVIINNVSRTFLSKKIPLRDNSEKIIGVLCVSFEITDRKKMEEDLKVAKESAESALKIMKQAQIKERKQRKAMELLKIEIATNKAQLNAQEEFSKMVGQIAHDINSPLTSLKTISAHCGALPEEERITLRNAVGRLMDITHYLLNLYRPQGEVNIDEDKQPIFLSAVLRDLLSEKSYQYHENSPIQFVTEFSQTGEFAFIYAQPSSLARAVSNLFSNAIQAIDEEAGGTVTLKLDADKEWVSISIQDTGKGMSLDTVEKIKKNIVFTEGKQDGHGIGLSQVRDMLVRNYGKMDVQSTPGRGSLLTLKFTRYPVPTWCPEGINLTPQDILVVLDDDPSIHGAWNMRFESILKQSPTLQLHHFEKGEEALHFIQGLNEEQRANLVLLTDYELLGTHLTGCDIIAKSKPNQAILVTSHYAETELRNKVMSLNAKMLPKQLAVVIPIQLFILQPQNLRQVDGVWLEDDQTLAKALKIHFREKKIDFYHTPNEFMQQIYHYPKTIQILLDNNFEGQDITGLQLAVQLHQEGFTRFILISGGTFPEGAVPDYITVVPKREILSLESYWL